MADTMTPEQRSRCMAAVKSRDTKPEMMVRKFLFSKGLRFRVKNSLYGHPDIVLPKYKTVVFIDGCFWHGHQGCKCFRLPSTNVDFWRQKINLNIARDYRTNVELRLLGWRVIRVWECELRPASTRAAVLDRIYRDITGKQATSPSAPYLPDDGQSIAAEPESPYGKS